MKNVRLEQRRDAKINGIIKRLEAGEKCWDYHLKESAFTKGQEGHEKVILTEGLAKAVIREIHDLYGHIEMYKCRKIFEEAFWVSKARKCKLIESCDSCQRNKVYTLPNEGLALNRLSRTITNIKGKYTLYFSNY